MRLRSLLPAALLFLCACTQATPSASHALPLYPACVWSEPKLEWRTVKDPDTGSERTFKGHAVTCTVDENEVGDSTPLVYKDSDFMDEDFWWYYVGNNALKNLGYPEAFVYEQSFDRQYMGLLNEQGNVVMLSSIREFDMPFPEDPQCPCKYTLSVFTDDERVLIE